MELASRAGSPLLDSSDSARVDIIWKPAFGTSFFSELLVLGHRNFLVILRSKLLFFARVGLMVCILKNLSKPFSNIIYRIPS
jgi:hypothetical protein